MKVFVGADHAGFRLKEDIKQFLFSKGEHVIDKGALKLDMNDDYPVFAALVAKAVVKEKTAKGIIVCGSAEGVCIAANKIKGIRAVAVFSGANAKLSRQHNDANVLCLSGWQLTPLKARPIVWTFLNTKFSGEERHVRRLKEISALEK